MPNGKPPSEPESVSDFNFDNIQEEKDIFYEPTKDRILVRPTMRESNIVLPGNKQMLDNPIAKVLAVGPGTTTIAGETVPLAMKVGDRVLVGGGLMQMMPLKVDGKPAFLMSANDILAIIRDKGEAKA